MREDLALSSPAIPAVKIVLTLVGSAAVGVAGICAALWAAYKSSTPAERAAMDAEMQRVAYAKFKVRPEDLTPNQARAVIDVVAEDHQLT
jgi:hypothetical protein